MMETETESGVHKPRIAEDCQEPLEAGGTPGTDSPSEPGEVFTPITGCL